MNSTSIPSSINSRPRRDNQIRDRDTKLPQIVGFSTNSKFETKKMLTGGLPKVTTSPFNSTVVSNVHKPQRNLELDDSIKKYFGSETTEGLMMTSSVKSSQLKAILAKKAQK